MREKTTLVSAYSARLGLNIHRGESKVLKVYAANTNSIMLQEEKLEEVDSFFYLGGIVDKTTGRDRL
jgi:hypothetical protein